MLVVAKNHETGMRNGHQKYKKMHYTLLTSFKLTSA